MQDSINEVDCITDHEGLQALCLNLWAIQTAYLSYRQHQGGPPDVIDHEHDEAN